MSNNKEIYRTLLDKCSRFDLKGKSTMYTSSNGHMFSFLNKEEEIGIRFSKEVQEMYFEKYKTSFYHSHGSVMKGYILLTESMLVEPENILVLLNESFDYVNSLPAK